MGCSIVFFNDNSFSSVEKLRQFDKLAREGQVKRAHIIEHELTEVRNDNVLQIRLREDAELQTRIIGATLQQERAIRLKDLHERRLILQAHQAAEKREKETISKLQEAIMKSERLVSQANGLGSAIRGQAMAMNENDRYIRETEREVESLKMNQDRLRSKLKEKQDETLHHMNVREQLEKECQRLRTQLIQISREVSKPYRADFTRIQKIPSLAMEKMFGRQPNVTMERWKKGPSGSVDSDLSLEKLSQDVRKIQLNHKNNFSLPDLTLSYQNKCSYVTSEAHDWKGS